MSIYIKKYTVSAKDVSMHRTMRPSMLLQLMQEAALDHNEKNGAGRAKTLDRGILWMVTHHYVQIARMPVLGEELTLASWPGDARHVMLPRYSRINDGCGNTLVNASSLWVLADSTTRSIVSPAKFGISIPGEVTGNEAPILWRTDEKATDRSLIFTVPYSYVDINGHMNNVRYFDLAEDCIQSSREGRKLLEMRCEYHSELRLGEEIRVDWGCSNGEYYFCGSDEKLRFRLSMKYE